MRPKIGSHRRSFLTSLANARPDPPPAHIRDEREWTIARLVRADGRRLVARAIRVVHEHRTAANVRARHEPPVATVLRAVAIVAHHEVVRRGYDERAPVVVRGLRGRQTESR